MKNTILKYGSYSALLGGLIFVGSHFFSWGMNLDILEFFGYASIFASLAFIYFGIRHYRDNLNNGLISFGKALLIGLAISAFAGLAIGLLDIIYVTAINPDFATEYVNHTLEGMKDNLSSSEFEAQKAQLLEDMKSYDSPAFAGFFMFALVFSIGILITLISSLLLQRKK